jgi:hypothetical protein
MMMSFVLLKGEWTYRIMYSNYFYERGVGDVILCPPRTVPNGQAKALRMTQRQVIKKTNRQNLCDCHPERSEGSQKYCI